MYFGSALFLGNFEAIELIEAIKPSRKLIAHFIIGDLNEPGTAGECFHFNDSVVLVEFRLGHVFVPC